MSFTILKPVTCPPRLKNLSVLSRDDLADLEWIFLERNPQEVMAIDFETKGDWGDPDSYPVGVSLSDSRGSLYIPFEQGTDTYEKVMRLLSQYQVPLIAHNVLFDGGWPLRDFGLWLNWKACTFAMYRLTATEGWPGQTWGLKSAQKDLLQWNETNEKKLDEWLVDNGYVSTASKEPKEGYVLRGTPGTEEARWLSPKKSEMWRAPVEILGHYACLDADACWLLYTYILKPAVDRYQVLSEYLFNMYPPFLRRLIEQKMYGIQIDIPKLTQYKEDLLNEIQTLQTHLLNSPEVKPHILQWNSLYIDEISRAEPPKYKKVRISPEPKRLTKSGKISGTWAKWDARRRDLEERGPELTLNWVKWQEKLEAAKKGQHFNLNSGKQLAWLLYERLQFPVEIRTDSGAPATDEDALLGMGEVGRMLIKLNELSKIVQFCDQTLELTRKDSSTIHPGFMAPGTLTGRLSGRNPNLQQVPKVGRFLECWVPRPGKVWVDCDHSAIEPVVLTELSKDPGLWTIYGPTAEPNDVYLFVGANLPGIGEKIRATGYVPEAPTKEAIQRAKKECKKERQIAKTVKLAADYGAGPGKLQYTLKVQGIPISLKEAEEIHAAFWRLFSGIREWRMELEAQHKFNRGWVLNGIGRPLGVWEEAKKDLVNRVCQSTGHDFHLYYQQVVAELLDEEGVEWKPIIVDFHDQMIVEVSPGDAERTKYLMGVRAYEILNARMGGLIRIKGEANVVENLAYAKVENWGKGS